MIKLENVSKSYSKSILKNISLEIKQGEFVAIVGESGKGKSTLLNIIGLLEKADSGKVFIDGECNIEPNSSKAAKVLRYKIKYLFQNFALIDEKNVYKNLMLSLQYVKANKKRKIQMIDSVLSKVGLEGYGNRKVFELSGGEQQRVAIARCMLKPCKIVLADEPTGSLDINNRDRVLKLLNELNKEGKTIIIVTHDKEVAESCGRIINL